MSQYLIKIVDAFVVKSQLSVLKEILMPLEKAVSGKKSNNMGKIVMFSVLNWSNVSKPKAKV